MGTKASCRTSLKIVYRKGVTNANADGLSRQATEDDAEDGRQISAGGCGQGHVTLRTYK